MTKGIKKQIAAARKAVDREIAANAQGGLYAAGLASEGYASGYRDCLSDVRQALHGVIPNNSRYWPQGEERAERDAREGQK